MDYYIKEFNDLQKDFNETVKNYPLFREMIDNIYDKDIDEINHLLEKNDEYYLKEAIKKLKNVIDYIKDTNEKITKEYDTFDKYADEWEKIRFNDVSDSYLKDINAKINKANTLIKSHDLADISYANKIMYDLLKELR